MSPNCWRIESRHQFGGSRLLGCVGWYLHQHQVGCPITQPLQKAPLEIESGFVAVEDEGGEDSG